MFIDDADYTGSGNISTTAPGTFDIYFFSSDSGKDIGFILNWKCTGNKLTQPRRLNKCSSTDGAAKNPIKSIFPKTIVLKKIQKKIGTKNICIKFL